MTPFGTFISKIGQQPLECTEGTEELTGTGGSSLQMRWKRSETAREPLAIGITLLIPTEGLGSCGGVPNDAPVNKGRCQEGRD